MGYTERARSTAEVSFADGSVRSCEVSFGRRRIFWVRIDGKCVYPKDWESKGIVGVKLYFIPFP